MPQKATMAKAQERSDRAKAEPKTLTVLVEIPGWLALQLDTIATTYGLTLQQVTVLACMTLHGGVESGDAAWIDGLTRTKEILSR